MKIFDDSDEDWGTRANVQLWVLQKGYVYNEIPPYASDSQIGGSSYTMLFTTREEAEQQLVDELLPLDVPYCIDIMGRQVMEELPEALAHEFVHEQPRYEKYYNTRILGSDKSEVCISSDTAMQAVFHTADRKVVIRLTENGFRRVQGRYDY